MLMVMMKVTFVLSKIAILQIIINFTFQWFILPYLIYVPNTYSIIGVG